MASPAPPTTVERPVPRLVVTAPETVAGHEIALRPGETVIGRAETADVVLDEHSLSSVHALVSVSEDGLVTLHDLRSSGGTFVNEERVTGPRQLVPGDVVRFGGLTTRFDGVPPRIPAVAAATGSIYTVTGTVSSPDSVNVAGLSVVLVDKNVGADDTLLVGGPVGGTGSYQLTATIDPRTLQANHKSAPDLQVRVLRADDVLAVSDVRWSAVADEVVDVVLPAGLAELPSEYETLTGAVAAHYPGALQVLQESDARQDVTYLANKTGWDARAIGMTVAAAGLAATAAGSKARTADAPAIDPALYYALLRAGLPADPAALHRTPIAVVSAAWDQAIAQNVVPAALAAQTSAALDTFASLAAADVLTAPTAGPSTLDALLRLTLGDDTARKQQFASLYVRYAGDADTLWSKVTDAFGADTSAALRLDGQLAYLTQNNAPLIAALHNHHRPAAAVDLATGGLYDAAAWRPLLKGVPVPGSVAGDTTAAKLGAYAELLAAQVRLAFPTASVSGMVRAGTLPTADAGLRDRVAGFLAEQQQSFDIGAEPVSRFLARNPAVSLGDDAVAQVTRIQRVYQFTPNTHAMAALLTDGIDSANAVVRLGPSALHAKYAGSLGADTVDALYAQAQHVNTMTSSLALSYVGAKIGSPYTSSLGSIIDQLGGVHQAPPVPVFAQATLDDLFGQLDYCACGDCQSILSPAAYLVDLLHSTDNPAARAPYHNPQDVLFGRRPDLENLPLTCDNTNVALPYLDLVNETLEYYVGNQLLIAGYPGHSTDGTESSAELNAAPVNDGDSMATAAYATLKTAWFPAPLPFHRDLELLRRHLAGLHLNLADVLRELRTDDAFRCPPPSNPATVYGWCDILAERLGLSRLEYRLLTDSTLTLAQVYGFPTGTADGTVVASLASLQEFSRRAGVAYTDVVTILETSYINPSSALVPLLKDLSVSVATLQGVHAGTITPAQFAALLPAGLDPTRYGPTATIPADVAAWVTGNYTAIMGLLVIDVTGTPSDTTKMLLAHLDPAASALTPMDLLRLARFIRVWQKLGLTVPQTDALLGALAPDPSTLTGSGGEKLDQLMRTTLARAGLVYELLDELGLAPADELENILPCWGPIGAAGADSLYRRLFLNPTVRAGTVFAPAADGSVLTTPGLHLLDQAEALCAAFHLTGTEFALLTGSSTTPVAGLGLGYDATTPLDLPHLSAIYRRAWLARTLGISVLELLALAALTGIDPFAPPVLDATLPVSVSMRDFVTLVKTLAAVDLTPAQALYLLWNVDLSGTPALAANVVTGLAASLRTSFAAVDSQFTVTPDVGLATLSNLMALVLGTTATNLFTGLLTDTFTTSVPFAHTASTLPAALLAAASGRVRLSYDDLGKQLTSGGFLDPATATAWAATVPADAALQAAIGALATANATAATAFFTAYDDSTLGLRTLFTAFISSADPAIAGNLPHLLGNLIPALALKRKQQQALTAVTAVAGTPAAFAPTLLGDPKLIPAARDATAPGVNDLVAAGVHGLAAAFYFADPANVDAATPDVTVASVTDLTYGAITLLRPAADPGAAPFAARWRGYVNAPQTGDVGLRIALDAGATVEVTIGGVVVAGTLDATTHTWTNSTPILLTAGVLTPVTLTGHGLTTTFAVTWRSLGTGYGPIPAGALFSGDAVADLGTTYLRFLKATALATDLSLGAGDLVYLATSPQLTVGGAGLLTGLATAGPAPAANHAGLRAALGGVLAYARVKARYAPAGTKLVDALTAAGTGDLTALRAVTGWDAASLDSLTARVFAGHPVTAVPGVDTPSALVRLGAAYDLIRTSGLSASTLIAATTNDPAPGTVQALRAALRSRLAEVDWLTAVTPISNELRELQRDALVAYILREAGATILATLGIATTPNRVATADDLFNYFLTDVEMQPCMETSRILHAISAVQLFVERCLRNLEPLVNPGDLAGIQWEWRKRYRVWQANREVFLWPENWLVPSLRDDQSPLFKTTLSTLLQSDMTDDAAVGAYLGYLRDLELIGKLEPCAIYYEPATATTAERTHVVARTAGAHRKHYYRRLDGASWSPWAEIKLQIDDEPVQFHVWDGRLMLFWLQFHSRSNTLDNGVAGALPQDNTHTLADAKLSDVSGAVGSTAGKATGQINSVVLCFSEYHHGTWLPMKSSDVAVPLDIDKGQFAGVYDRSKLAIRPWHAVAADDGALYVQVIIRSGTPALRKASTEDNGSQTSVGFVVHNTHSTPLRWADVSVTAIQNPIRLRDVATGPQIVGAGPARFNLRFDLSADYLVGAGANPTAGDYTDVAFDEQILRGRLPQSLRISQADVASQWTQPFLFTDARNVFYVTTSIRQAAYGSYGGYVFGDHASGSPKVRIPALVSANLAKAPLRDGPDVALGRLGGAGPIEAIPGMYAVINGNDTFTLNGRDIAVAGSTATAARASADEAAGTAADGRIA